ncbi:hypothetical protein KAU33_09250 [Candidatus Dependentiae bacterium]|nr:hypothetical protein [Candidatus Dependentiae bacterium]
MTLYELCLEYLDALNSMTSRNHTVFLYEYEKEQFLKASLSDAIDIRTKIAEELECDIDRLIMITDNLDTAIDFFVPLLGRHDNIGVYARNMEQLLTCTACRMFLSGKTNRLTTAYGIIEETRPLTV